MASQAPSKREGDAPAEATDLIRGAAAAPGAGEAANQSRLPEELWGNVFSFLRAGEVHAVSQEMAAALRRPRLWQTFARHAGLKSFFEVPGPSGPERFRRARQLDGNAGIGPVSGEDSEVESELTCLVVVTQHDPNPVAGGPPVTRKIFRARFPFALSACDHEMGNFYAPGARVGIAVEACARLPDTPRTLSMRPEHFLRVPATLVPFFAQDLGDDDPYPDPDNLEITYYLERPDGRIAKLVTFGPRELIPDADVGPGSLFWSKHQLTTEFDDWLFDLELSVVCPVEPEELGLEEFGMKLAGGELAGLVRSLQLTVNLRDNRNGHALVDDGLGPHIIESLTNWISGTGSRLVWC